MIEIKSDNPGSLITHWQLFYWDGKAWQSDNQWHGIGDSIRAPVTNYLACYTYNFWGTVSGPYYSNYFEGVDGRKYVYDILNGIVTPEAIKSEFLELTVRYAKGG